MLGGNLALANVNRQVEKVFEISGILKIIPIIKESEDNYKEKRRRKCWEFMIMK